MQGGSGLPFLAVPVYDYLCTGKNTGIVVSSDEIPDPTLRFVVDKVGHLYYTTRADIMK